MNRKGGARRAALVCTMAAAMALSQASSPARAAQREGLRVYQDPQGRFRFDYPVRFGTAQTGTNDGFGDRLAAVRFSDLPGLGGEAALTRGPLVLDVQALGGLYDPITFEVFPDASRRQLEAVRPKVDRGSLCQALGVEDHLAAVTSLPPALRGAARTVGRMRNVAPRVVRCTVTGDRAVFHKEATYEAGTVSVRQHIFGAVRFLSGGEATVFQIVRVLTVPPTTAQLAELDALVGSFAR